MAAYASRACATLAATCADICTCVYVYNVLSVYMYVRVRVCMCVGVCA